MNFIIKVTSLPAEPFIVSPVDRLCENYFIFHAHATLPCDRQYFSFSAYRLLAVLCVTMGENLGKIPRFSARNT